MKEIQFLPFPELSTEHFILRQITADDENEIFFLRSDERVLKHLDIKRAVTIDDAREFITMISEGIVNNEAILWGIVFKNEKKIIGTICLWNISVPESKADIGFVLHPDYHGKGVIQEIMPAVLDYGFNKLGLDKIEGEASPHNIKSVQLLLKFGFEYARRYENTVIYSLPNRVI